MTKTLAKRAAVAALVAGAAAAFWIFDLGQYLTLPYLKESRERFIAFYATNPAEVIGFYMIIYIAAAALSLPGAAVLSLAGGAVFGLVTGTVIISFASSIGATLSCAVSRFILRDWLQKKFGRRLEPINAGIEKEGAFYLFTLRLIPVFPFWLVNLAMGITRMPLGKYYLISQAGMLPATIVYVNAGRELGKLESAAGILSPGLVASFALLGIFPLAARKAVSLYRSRQANRN